MTTACHLFLHCNPPHYPIASSGCIMQHHKTHCPRRRATYIERTHTYWCIHIVCAHVCSHAHTLCMHKSKRLFVRVCTCARTHIVTHICTHTRAHTCAHVHTHIHMCTHVQTHICAYTHINLHTHMCAHKRARARTHTYIMCTQAHVRTHTSSTHTHTRIKHTHIKHTRM